jgi:flagellar assembly protein FliH
LQGELVVIQNKPPAGLQHEDKKEEKFDTRSVDEIAQERANVILMEAQRQAEALVRTAQLEAARIKGEADSLHGQAKELGHREGFEEGLAQGRQAAEKEMKLAVEQAVQNANRLIRAAEQQQVEFLVDAERQVLELVLECVRKVLAREVEENPLVVLPIVTAAISKVKDQDSIQIRVHPDDYETVLMARRDLQLLIGREEGLRITADHTVSPGGCIVETTAGTVDARMETQMEMLQRALKEVTP